MRQLSNIVKTVGLHLSPLGSVPGAVSISVGQNYEPPETDSLMMFNSNILFCASIGPAILVATTWQVRGCGFIAILGALYIAFQLTAADSHIADARTRLGISGTAGIKC